MSEEISIRQQAEKDEYFEDGKRKIDFILVWKKEQKIGKSLKNKVSKKNSFDEKEWNNPDEVIQFLKELENENIEYEGQDNVYSSVYQFILPISIGYLLYLIQGSTC